MSASRWLLVILSGIALIVAMRIAVAAAACDVITPAPAYSSVNIRREPTIADNVTGRLLRGQAANVAGLSGGWYELSFGGYVAASVVTCAAPAPTPTRLVTETPIVTAPTPVIFVVCIQDICSTFSSPITVTITEYEPGK